VCFFTVPGLSLLTRLALTVGQKSAVRLIEGAPARRQLTHAETLDNQPNDFSTWLAKTDSL